MEAWFIFPRGPGLAVEVHRDVVAGQLAVELLNEFLPLGHLALEDAAEVARVSDDVGRQEEQQVGLDVLLRRLAEKDAQHRDVAEHRTFEAFSMVAVLHDAADDHGLLILGDHGRLGGPLGEWSARAPGHWTRSLRLTR